MRRLSLLLAVLLVAPLCSADSPKDYDDRVEVTGVEGTWRLTGRDDGWKITFRGGAFVVNYSSGDIGRGTYAIEPNKKPSHLDTDGCKYIYQIDGDTLRIAGIGFYVQRPQGFNDKGITLYTYKRVK